MAINSTSHVLPYIAAGITVVLWASAFPGIRASLSAYPPAHIALLRYGTASCLLGVYAIVTRLPMPQWRDVPTFLGLGAVGISFYNVALNTGELTVPSGVASFIVASAPIFMALQASRFLGERIHGWGWIGIGISFSGVALMSLHRGTGWTVDWPVLLVIAAAIAQSVYSIGQKALLRRYSPLACTAYAIWGGTLLLLIFIPGLGREVHAAPLSATLAAVYLGIFPGAVAYVAWLGEVPMALDIFGGTLVIAGCSSSTPADVLQQ